ncbi:MAG: aspartate carbamoyltransferase catalytic subunit [Steroidobacteraceae bacterium]|nr:aspartate carbamoyltransferase catalytic subunit [Nevskiaceae bacterium]MCP5339802.1 aspartate carbamoyltransferase catalytic subunit [Nevskiaceae bacterium]MCP5360330.1 aspartate carbamoyltransferase catalytic subunit [Nevskiaceae bacterium]MCP5467256.1 aspartate carbamoyltransferase catalytic subunit [Nevskiaceae bacterium]MCP5471169.1 aspartate carbamoyltransferase catalytic subunit [Nevskiaceae bacterium]
MNQQSHERAPALHADGSLRHLLTLEGLPRALLERLLERAQHYSRPLGTPPARSQALQGITVATLFTEPSTRTRVSFELAAQRLGADVASIEMQLSSRLKGESMLDTIRTLESLHVDVFVLRDAQTDVPDLVARNVAAHVSVLSGGAGNYAHPTQGLLDTLTILQHKGRIAGLSIAIVGDVRHSRVARSAWHAFATLGATDIRLVAPPALMPNEQEFGGCARFHRLEDGIAGCDVVMMLRIQKERMTEAAIPGAAEYFAEWGLTPQRLAAARPDAIVMHPQPMNRGIEIASQVADGPQSVIRDQVRNGVAVRMAVLEAVIAGRSSPALSTGKDAADWRQRGPRP